MIVIYVYILVVIRAGGSVNILISLVVMEVLSWLFIQFLPTWRVLKYLFLQGVFFVFIVMSIIWIKPFLVVGLMLKIGIPPFHLWAIRLMLEIELVSFGIMLTLHKFMPTLILAKALKEFVLLFMLGLILVSLRVLISNLSNLLMVLVLSSILHTLWMRFGGIIRLNIICAYWLRYRVLLILILKSINIDYVLYTLINQRMLSNFMWLLLSGIPPFTMFWLKAHIVVVIISSVGFLARTIIVFGRVLALRAYYRVWHFRNLQVKFRLSSMLVLGAFLLTTLTLSK